MINYIRLISFIILLPFSSQGQYIYTVAGIPDSAGYSGDGGPATAAKISFPNVLSLDAIGNVYIFDGSIKVRKVATSGVITVFAGNGVPRLSSLSDTGMGSAATTVPLNNVKGMHCDSRNNVYLAAVHSVRMVSSSGILTNVVGTGVAGYRTLDGVPATAAGLYNVFDVYLDKREQLYFIDSSGAYIKYVDNAGIVRRLAGNGILGYDTAQGVAATSVAINAQAVTGDLYGNIFITCPGYPVIKKIDPSGIISVYAGNGTYGHSGDGGPATAAEIDALVNDIATDTAGNLYFTEGTKNTIRKISRAGIITTIAGTVDSAGFRGDRGYPATAAKMDYPCRLEVARNGDIYFCDGQNDCVRRIAMDTTTSRSGGDTTLSSAQPYVQFADVQLTPNPAKGMVLLNCILSAVQYMDVSVYSADGKLTWQGKGHTNQPMEIPLPQKGMYFVTIRLPRETITKPVVSE